MKARALICSLLSLSTVLAQGNAPSEQLAFFESKVRPILLERCVECHNAEKTKGGLSLETRLDWKKGGDSGQVILPGNPDGSLLVKAIGYSDPDLAMPPKDKGGKLSVPEIAALREWIAMGAPDPREAGAKIGGMKEETAKNWWAFQPLQKPDQAPASGKIDAFLEAKIAAQGLSTNAPADKYTLLRRLSYTLTGLPPSPENMDAFLADTSPQAFPAAIEKLLASPEYGIHWARHWLDIVRYADTAGENSDRPLPHVWRYRNWVIEAFNQDLPYDQFAKLQIAGDILQQDMPEQDRNEGIIATGYLAVARRFGHDIDKDIHLMHEDVIDNLGKTFLGLTTGCARCHDHKYDPITAQDYYALYGIFNSTKFAFPGCEPKGQPRDLVPLIPQSEVDALLNPWMERSKQAEAEKKKRLEAVKEENKIVYETAAGTSKILAKAQVGEGKSVNLADAALQSLSNIRVRKGEMLQLTVDPNNNHGADSTLIEWSIAETGGSGGHWSVADLVHSLSDGNPHAGTRGAEWCFFESTPKGPSFLTQKKESIRGNSALKAWSLGDEPSVFVNSSEQQVMAWTTLEANAFFVHPGPKRPVSVAWVCPVDGEFAVSGRVADVHPAQLDGVSFTLEHIPSPQYGPALVRIGKNLTDKAADPEPPPVFPVAYAVVEGTVKNAALQVKGDPEKTAVEVPRRWLSVFGGEQVPDNAGSGRRHLANWIVREPIAARVMVNRIWQWHFGSGLVRSANDFGSRGEPPSHPQLLEWLASEFVASGYSVKAMHRLILNTAAFQRSSERRDETLQADPDNRLLCRFSRRRLAAEEIRDSLLLSSGQLDRTPAQAHPFPPESTWKYSQHGPFNADYPTLRRSLYMMVQRQRRHPFLSLFDGADPNANTPTRQTTTVPTQALYFLNDPFFRQQADAFATKLKAAPTEQARIAEAYRILFQRKPSAEEINAAAAFLSNYPADSAQRWSALARVLMASNAFLHID